MFRPERGLLKKCQPQRLSGNKIMPSLCEINPAGFVIYSAVHAARADAH